MKKLFILSILALLISPIIAAAQTHEYSPLAEKTVNYENWELPNVITEKPEDLRKLMAGKKLVMIVYFAPWCGNWKFEAPIAAKLYEKYKAQGFQVIGVSEYASRADVRTYFGEAGPPYPVVVESESRADKIKYTSLQVPATHGRYSIVGFAVEYLSRTRQGESYRQRARRKSVGGEWRID